MQYPSQVSTLLESIAMLPAFGMVMLSAPVFHGQTWHARARAHNHPRVQPLPSHTDARDHCRHACAIQCRDNILAYLRSPGASDHRSIKALQALLSAWDAAARDPDSRAAFEAPASPCSPAPVSKHKLPFDLEAMMRLYRGHPDRLHETYAQSDRLYELLLEPKSSAKATSEHLIKQSIGTTPPTTVRQTLEGALMILARKLARENGLDHASPAVVCKGFASHAIESWALASLIPVESQQRLG